MIVAIDGPAGAGKSTIAREVSRRLGYLYIDTGAMYRAVAWMALDSGVLPADEGGVSRLAEGSRIELSGTADCLRVHIQGRDVTAQIRTPEVSQAASIVSAIPAVRRALVARQQEMGAKGDVVMEGRDIGTVVFPQAEVKIFLDASSEARAGRRFVEDRSKGIDTSLEDTRSAIEERDLRDRSRQDSPLAAASDAVYLDSSNSGIEEMIEKVLEIVKEKARVYRHH